MASTGTNGGGSLPRDFYLTPHQQSLLFAALNANHQSGLGAPVAASNNGVSMSPNSLKNSPMQNNSIQESPFLDNLDYDFGDSSFDFSFQNDDQSKMIGDLSDSVKSESPDADAHEKRSHPDDEDDSPGNDAKRRENQDKVPKKPGRKPLTSEPTSKRKAQNRAAQRAFRERKEKHLKDLETKIEELEKASEAANSENSLLRAQVEKITAELTQYKHKMQAMAQRPLSREKVPFGNAAVNSLNDVNFQFEFPKFGTLPGPPVQKADTSSSNSVSPQNKTLAASPAQSLSSESKPSPASQQAQNAHFKEDLAKFSNIFTPSMSSSAGTAASRGSLDSANFSLNGATSSPSASSNSNVGPTSSCGTSPEPLTQSPMGFKPLDAIGEEQQPSIAKSEQPFTDFANLDFSNNNSLDWLSQQNGGQFDPQLFGGYREPQENILANPSFDEFFNDAFDADFFTPYNAAPATPSVQKKNLIAEIDAKQNDIVNDVAPAESTKRCDQIWDKLQECPNAKNGDFDLDGLCTELTAKATCSGNGPMVKETDFDTILKKYMGKDAPSDCVASKLGIEVTRGA